MSDNHLYEASRTDLWSERQSRVSTKGDSQDYGKQLRFFADVCDLTGLNTHLEGKTRANVSFMLEPMGWFSAWGWNSWHGYFRLPLLDAESVVKLGQTMGEIVSGCLADEAYKP